MGKAILPKMTSTIPKSRNRLTRPKSDAFSQLLDLVLNYPRGINEKNNSVPSGIDRFPFFQPLAGLGPFDFGEPLLLERLSGLMPLGNPPPCQVSIEVCGQLIVEVRG